MARHHPGQSLPNQTPRVTDKQAAARAGCSTSDVLYEDPRDDVFPPEPERPLVLGRCPHDGTVLYQDPCNPDFMVCEWTGHKVRWPE